MTPHEILETVYFRPRLAVRHKVRESLDVNVKLSRQIHYSVGQPIQWEVLDKVRRVCHPISNSIRL